MICLNCGFENVDGTRYCARCGADSIELDWRSARPGTEKWRKYERLGYPMHESPRAVPTASEYPDAHYSIFQDENEGEITVSRDIWQNEDLKVSLRREKTGEVISIEGDSEVIGKGSQASRRIDGNPRISRTHLNIFRMGDRVFVEDMNSSNHTFVNGKRITAPVQVGDGTRIQLADELFTIHIKSSAKAADPGSGRTFCGNCGAEVPPGINFCGNCGARV